MHTIRGRSLWPCALAALAGPAGAAGFQLLEQNSSGLGNSYAGSAAVAENASTIFYNPAGLTRLADREVSAGLLAANIKINFTDHGSQVSTLSGAGDGGNAGGNAFIPNSYMSWRLSQDWYAGLGVEAPFGLRTNYDSPWKGGAQSLLFDIKVASLNPTLAYRVNESLSLGAGLDWQYMLAEYRRLGGTFFLLPGLATTVADMKLHGSAWGWNVGALLTVSPKLRFGLSYRSAVSHDLSGSLRFTGTLAQNAALGGAATNREVGTTVKLPDTFILSTVYELDDRWQLLGDVSRTGWSSIQQVDIVNLQTVGGNAKAGGLVQRLDTLFRDSWRVALGATYRVNRSLSLKTGLALDQSPVRSDKTRLTALPDSNRLWLSAGVQWKPSERSTLDIGVGKLLTKNPRINNDQTSGQGVLERGIVTGEYELSAWAVGANYAAVF